jgi:hypothetical protein
LLAGAIHDGETVIVDVSASKDALEVHAS